VNAVAAAAAVAAASLTSEYTHLVFDYNNSRVFALSEDSFNFVLVGPTEAAAAAVAARFARGRASALVLKFKDMEA